MTRLLIIAAILLAFMIPNAGYTAETPVEVTVNNGRVSIHAANAAVSDVLASWARAGGTIILNGDKIRGPALTLELSDVPEPQALEILLRSTAGFLAVPRAALGPNQSMFARIVIMPASRAAPAASPLVLVPAAAQPGPQPLPIVARRVDKAGQPLADDQTDAPPPGVVAAPPGFSRGDPPPSYPPGSLPARAATSPASTPASSTAPAPGMTVAPPAQPQRQQPQQ